MFRGDLALLYLARLEPLMGRLVNLNNHFRALDKASRLCYDTFQQRPILRINLKVAA